MTPVDNPHFLPPNLPSNSPRALLALHILRTCPDVISLINAMNPALPNMVDVHGPRYFKYNFVPLLDSADPSNPYCQSGMEQLSIGPITPKQKAPTIEFRQHIGTLDPDTMTFWVKILGAIVELAGKLTSETIVQFLGLDKWTVREVENETKEQPPASSSNEPDYHRRRSLRQEYIRIPESDCPDPTSAFSLLSTLHPVGSFERLCEALEFAHVPLDKETYRFWRRKA